MRGDVGNEPGYSCRASFWTVKVFDAEACVDRKAQSKSDLENRSNGEIDFPRSVSIHFSLGA
jgi:hypothetical protein